MRECAHHVPHLHHFGAGSTESKFSKLLSGLKKVWLRGLDLNQRPLGYEPYNNISRLCLSIT